MPLTQELLGERKGLQVNCVLCREDSSCSEHRDHSGPRWARINRVSLQLLRCLCTLLLGLADLTLLMDHGRVSSFTLSLTQAPLQWGSVKSFHRKCGNKWGLALSFLRGRQDCHSYAWKEFLMTSPGLGCSWLQGEGVCRGRDLLYGTERWVLVKVQKPVFRFSYPTSHREWNGNWKMHLNSCTPEVRQWPFPRIRVF